MNVWNGLGDCFTDALLWLRPKGTGQGRYNYWPGKKNRWFQDLECLTFMWFELVAFSFLLGEWVPLSNHLCKFWLWQNVVKCILKIFQECPQHDRVEKQNRNINTYMFRECVSSPFRTQIREAGRRVVLHSWGVSRLSVIPPGPNNSVARRTLFWCREKERHLACRLWETGRTGYSGPSPYVYIKKA